MSNLEKTLILLKVRLLPPMRQYPSSQPRRPISSPPGENGEDPIRSQQGNTDGARIYAANAIRKKNEGLNLFLLSSQIDVVASRVETAVTMRSVIGDMTSVVRGMDNAMESMNLERPTTPITRYNSLHSCSTPNTDPVLNTRRPPPTMYPQS